MPERAIRILLADDHMVVRAGVAQVIAETADLRVVAEAQSGEEALLLCQRHAPDVVLMDVEMQGMGGVGATEAIRRYHPAVRVIGLSSYADRGSVGAMLAAGAGGYLTKTVSAEELAGAIRRVHAGETVIDARCAGEPAAPPAPPEAAVGLRGQQRRVLALLTKGYTNGEIATYLGISLPTARYHVSAILLKLGVSNRAEAAALAIRDRLIDDGDF